MGYGATVKSWFFLTGNVALLSRAGVKRESRMVTSALQGAEPGRGSGVGRGLGVGVGLGGDGVGQGRGK